MEKALFKGESLFTSRRVFNPVATCRLLDQLRFSVSAIIAGFSRFCAPLPEPEPSALNGYDIASSKSTSANGAAASLPEAAANGGGKPAGTAFANGKRMSERDDESAAAAQQQSSKKRRSSTVSDS
jgi:hypothetical protein